MTGEIPDTDLHDPAKLPDYDDDEKFLKQLKSRHHRAEHNCIRVPSRYAAQLEESNAAVRVDQAVKDAARTFLSSIASDTTIHNLHTAHMLNDHGVKNYSQTVIDMQAECAYLLDNLSARAHRVTTSANIKGGTIAGMNAAPRLLRKKLLQLSDRQRASSGADTELLTLCHDAVQHFAAAWSQSGLQAALNSVETHGRPL